MGTKWSQEQKDAASERMLAKGKAKKSAETSERMRINLGGKRDVLNLPDSQEGFRTRMVNDIGGRVAELTKRGYEIVTDASQGTSHVDGYDEGTVIRDVGKGVTGVADKQKIVDESEADMRRKKVNPNDSTDGTYGEVKIG